MADNQPTTAGAAQVTSVADASAVGASSAAPANKPLPEYAIKALSKPDVSAVAVFLRIYRGNVNDAITQLMRVHGNAFVQQVLTYRPTAQELSIGTERYSLGKTKRDFTMPGMTDRSLYEKSVTYTHHEDDNEGSTRFGADAKAHHASVQKEKAEASPFAKHGKLGDLAKQVEISTQLTSSYGADWLHAETEQFDAGGGATAQIGTRAMHLERIAGAKVGANGERLQISGNAGATATVMGARAQIASPELTFDLLGESVGAAVSLSVDAAALAELKGKASLDIGKQGLGIHASLSGFAGVKGGVTAAGTLVWHAKSPDHYAKLIMRGSGWRPLLSKFVPATLLNKVSDDRALKWVEKIVNMLITGNGDALVMGAFARTEASAGLGGIAEASLGFRGGVLHCHAHAGLTFGLGAAANCDLALGVSDGMALLGILAMRGVPQLADALAPSIQVTEYVKSKVLGMTSVDGTAHATAPDVHAPAKVASADVPADVPQA